MRHIVSLFLYAKRYPARPNTSYIHGARAIVKPAAYRVYPYTVPAAMPQAGSLYRYCPCDGRRLSGGGPVNARGISGNAGDTSSISRDTASASGDASSVSGDASGTLGGISSVYRDTASVLGDISHDKKGD